MEIEKLGEPKIIFFNKGIHNYFAWPTVARLKDDSIMAVCSGFRLKHICPFGKVATIVSLDEGEKYSLPQIVMDSCLDDRDGGLCPFGESGVVVTSFNNTVDFQKKQFHGPFGNKEYRVMRAYALSYLKQVTSEAEKAALGATFTVSFDNGKTFGPICKSPITSPHGPIELDSGEILWVGQVFDDKDGNVLRAYVLDPLSGKMTCRGEIEKITLDGEELSVSEPYCIQLDDGSLLCHIRVERGGAKRIFTLYQCRSHDGGRSWTKPKRILEPTGGAPSHILRHSSGVLICTYGYRNDPPAIRAIFSRDNGENWSDPVTVCDQIAPTWDMGYPSCVELKNGDILTVFYAHPEIDGPANIMQQKWRIKK